MNRLISRLADPHAAWGETEQPARRQWRVVLARALARPLSDALYLRLAHRLYYGRWPDYEHPLTLQEHIQAYVLRSRDPALVMLADKVAVRAYIERAVGPGHTVPLLGHWTDAAAVPLATLPYPLVLKPSHLSGRTLFLDAHRPQDERALRRRLADWLARDHSRINREWFYREVPPGLVAEPRLQGPDGDLPPDVKAYVVGGRVRYFQVDRGRLGRHTRRLYGPDWSPLAARTSLPRHAADAPPPDLARLVALAERLAEPFEFLRVDFYVIGEQVLVGELTSSPGAGFGRFFPSSFSEGLAAQWVRRPVSRPEAPPRAARTA